MLFGLLKKKKPQSASSTESAIKKKLVRLQQAEENLLIYCQQQKMTRKIQELDFQKQLILLNDEIPQGALQVSCHYFGKGLSFQSHSVDNDQQLPYIAIPQTINMQQRRQAYRVSLSQHSRCSISIDGDDAKPSQGPILDISISGIQAMFQLDSVKNLDVGSHIKNCSLNLGEHLILNCQLEVKRLVDSHINNFICIGAQYCELNRRSESALGQFIAKNQRQNQFSATRG